MERAKDMVISGGNIFPIEIEGILITKLEITDCSVIGIPDEDFGERWLAFAVPSPDTQGLLDQKISRLTSRITNNKVPRETIVFCSLPREDPGKIFKKELKS